ncbi:MAG: hypothetical protein AAF658_00730 [Myxococcota bacterium]
MVKRLTFFCVALGFLSCSENTPQAVTPQSDIDPENPRWRFEVINHGTGDTTFNDVWTNSRGDAFIAGWFGTIITNRSGTWEVMPTPTTENLTAIMGVNNGNRFRLPDLADGEMFAVGWNGTVLYYHPDPNGDEDPADGEWRLVAGMGESSDPMMPPFFAPVTRIDPACPDFDGDGIADDGNGDGWSGNFGGATLVCGLPGAPGAGACDDNCRSTPNGTLRPLRDTNAVGIDGGCLGPGDMPVPGESQLDRDNDGIGLVCDDDDESPAAQDLFLSTLFDLHVEVDDDALTVVAVGEAGSILSFLGDSNSAAVRGTADPTQTFGLEDPRAWTAQTGLAFRFSTDDDCDGDGIDQRLADGGCGGRLYPSCPAQCNPRKSTCDCLPADGQCCDATASTGVGCTAGVDTCAPAINACADTGLCTTLCPDCFRRLDDTLRSVAVSNGTVVAVGASGTIVTLDVATVMLDNPLAGTWTAPSCATPDPPLDENPLLTAVGANNGAFVTAGAAGALFNLDLANENCPAGTIDGVPPGFISAIEVLGGGRRFAVGDQGLFVQLGGGAVDIIPTQIRENFLGLTRSRFDDEEGEPVERFWLVGATGRVVRAGFF